MPCTDPSPGNAAAATDLLGTVVHLLDLADQIEPVVARLYDDARIGPPGLVLVDLDQLVRLIGLAERVQADLKSTLAAMRAWQESGEATPWRGDTTSADAYKRLVLAHAKHAILDHASSVEPSQSAHAALNESASGLRAARAAVESAWRRLLVEAADHTVLCIVLGQTPPQGSAERRVYAASVALARAADPEAETIVEALQAWRGSLAGGAA